MEVTLRDRSLDDAERFWNILNNDNFHWFGKPPETVEGEKTYIEKDMNNPLMRNYTIMYGNDIVGGIGIRIDSHRNWIAEIGYFVDENYWNKGIATKSLLLCEDKARELKIKRIELIIDVDNDSSKHVAIKSGYVLDCRLSRKLKNPRTGEFSECYLCSKLID